MSLDMQKLREKLEQLKNPKNKRNEKRDKRTWSPDQSKPNSIRLLQTPFSDDPLKELWFHYDIGKGPGILCLKENYGKSCPACEFGYDLFKNGDKVTSKKMFPRQRVYCAMIDRADEEPTPRYWGFGKEIYQQLIEALLD